MKYLENFVVNYLGDLYSKVISISIHLVVRFSAAIMVGIALWTSLEVKGLLFYMICFYAFSLAFSPLVKFLRLMFGYSLADQKLADIQAEINIAKAYQKGFRENLISDGFHSFSELYEFRKVYNALLFNEWSKHGLYDVHKSWLHADGSEIFPESKHNWFKVSAMLPGGEVSNHYKAADWGLFCVPEAGRAKYEYDGHSSEDVLDRYYGVLGAKTEVFGKSRASN